MNVKKICSLILVLVLTTVLMTACGECKHDYQERDGRVICVECKEVCNHTYKTDANGTYCTNCLFSCKHSYSENNGEMVCAQCGVKCGHKYSEGTCETCGKECVHEFGTDGKCAVCKLDCSHKYEEKAGEMVCAQCGLKCNHKYILKDGKGVCEYCAQDCLHEYEEANGKRTCKKCGHEKILLTMDNVNDYFSVTVKIFDVTVQKDWVGTKDIGTANAEVKVSNKKGVKYENVVLTVRLETSTDAWMNQSREIEISYDGTGEETFSFSSKIENYVYAHPSYKVVIIGVTGEIAD